MPTQEQINYASENYVSHVGMPSQAITDIDLTVRKYAHDYVPFWKQLCETKDFVKGRKEYQYRVTVRPEVRVSDWQPLVEGYGTTATSISVATYSFTYSNYGKHLKYTKESVEENLDDTKAMAIDNFSTYAEEVPEAIIADVLTKSSFTFTADASMLKTLDKVSNIHAAKHARKFPEIGGNGWPCILSTPLLTKFKQELRDEKFNALDEGTKGNITIDGEIYKVNGFTLIVRDDDCMFAKDAEGNITGYKMFFPTITRNGLKPGVRIPESIKVFDNGLGSGLIKDPTTGEMVEDTNRRAGSMAINIDHLGAKLQQSLGMLMTTIASSAVTTGSVAEGDVDELKEADKTEKAPADKAGA